MEQNQQNQVTNPSETQNSNLLNNVTSTETKTKQTSGLYILFWLILFAPIGFYLLWKEKRLHGWFPNLLIFFWNPKYFARCYHDAFCFSQTG